MEGQTEKTIVQSYSTFATFVNLTTDKKIELVSNRLKNAVFYVAIICDDHFDYELFKGLTKEFDLPDYPESCEEIQSFKLNLEAALEDKHVLSYLNATLTHIINDSRMQVSKLGALQPHLEHKLRCLKALFDYYYHKFSDIEDQDRCQNLANLVGYFINGVSKKSSKQTFFSKPESKPYPCSALRSETSYELRETPFDRCLKAALVETQDECDEHWGEGAIIELKEEEFGLKRSHSLEDLAGLASDLSVNEKEQIEKECGHQQQNDFVLSNFTETADEEIDPVLQEVLMESYKCFNN